MNILFAASEAVPFCKSGALGDVAGSLPPALAAEGIEVSAVIPLYLTVKEKYFDQLEFVVSDYVNLAWRRAYCGLYKLVKDGVTWYFLDNEQYFQREELYGHMDDGERFGFFSHAVLKMLMYMDSKPDIIHCNDWQTALIPVYLRTDSVQEPWFRSIKTVLTIHDMEYQGVYNIKTLGDLFGLQHTCVNDGTMIMHGDVNLLKAGIVCANAVTTVSPTYAEEIGLEYFAHSLESIIHKYSFKIQGILNGFDSVRFNPDIDKLLAVNYNLDSVGNRIGNKEHLQAVGGLKADTSIPLIGIVTSFAQYKGLDIICEAFDDIIKLGVQIAVIGFGDSRYENFFKWAAKEYPGSVSYKHGYTVESAAALYSGADFLLMPSMIEPCGINQMIALRYGCVPIVRATGGLKDTVKPYNSQFENGTGFVFGSYTAGDLSFTVKNAVELYKNNPAAFKELQKRGMAENFSLQRCADEYIEVYKGILS